MPVEEILYKTDYLNNGQTVYGSFPVVINGNINCNVDITDNQRAIVLGEGLDNSVALQRQYLQSFDGNYYNVNDGSSGLILYF